MLPECLIEWRREPGGVALRNEGGFRGRVLLMSENDREDDNGVEVAKLCINDDAGTLASLSDEEYWIIKKVGNECEGVPLCERVCADHCRFADLLTEGLDTISTVLNGALFSDA